jgi:hypothetical protein
MFRRTDVPERELSIGEFTSNTGGSVMGSVGTKTILALVGLTKSRLWLDIAIVRISINAKALPILPMLIIRYIEPIKGYSHKFLDYG